MKAEHRKELETNLLADRMGLLVQRMKTRPQRRTMLISLLVGVVVVAGLVWWNFIREDTQIITANRWYILERGTNSYGPNELAVTMDQLAGFQIGYQQSEAKKPDRERKYVKVDYPSEFDKPGKAARFEVARYFLWDLGVKKLGFATFADRASKTPLDRIEYAHELYIGLLRQCENEPEWKAEALYGLAVIDETRALQDIKMLSKAKDKYKNLMETLPLTGHGKLAEKRYKDLHARFAEVTLFYEEMRRELDMPPLSRKEVRFGNIP